MKGMPGVPGSDRPLVLIVDDDINDELVGLPEYLDWSGFAIRTASGLTQWGRLIATLRDEGAVPSLAIVDLIMSPVDPADVLLAAPRLAGLAAIRTLHEAFPDTPAIMLTVAGSEQVQALGFAGRVLTKPIEPQQLLDASREAMRGLPLHGG